MTDSLFTHPLYAAVLVIVVAIWAIPDAYEGVTRRANRDFALVTDRGSLQLFRILLTAGILFAGLLARFHPVGTLPGHRPWLFVAGAILVLGGLALRRWAIATLGRYFTVDVAVQEGQRVIEAPPYRRIRHPAYSGSILSLLGIGLMLGHWLGLTLICLAAATAFAYRVRLEERVLLDALGEPYADYMRRTRRFIPFLW